MTTAKLSTEAQDLIKNLTNYSFTMSDIADAMCDGSVLKDLDQDQDQAVVEEVYDYCKNQSKEF